MKINREEYNFKGEQYFAISESLYSSMKIIAEKLQSNLQSEEYSVLVSQLIMAPKKRSNVRNYFQSRWPSNNNGEYKGIYAFGELDTNHCNAIYIGITQSMLRRFLGHTVMKEKQHATFAYLMSKHEESIRVSGKFNKMLKLEKNVAHEKIKIYQEYIQKLRFTFYPMSDNTEMHIAEAFCASYLKTFWNSFETH